jgi:hypothetical protein
MFTVTDEAKAVLHQILDTAQQQIPPGGRPSDDTLALRLIPEPQGLGFALDTEIEGDQVISFKDQPLLLIGEDVADIVDGHTLGVHAHDDGHEHLELYRGKPGEGHIHT